MGFAEPSQGVSLAPVEALPTLPPAPSVTPEDFHQQSGVPLDRIVPAPKDLRDPSRPFSTATLIMTEVGGHTARTAQDPFRVVSSTSTNTWAPPPSTATPAPVIHPVTLTDCWAAAYPPMLISLFVVGVVGTVQPLFPVALFIAAPFLFIPRVRFRVGQVKAVCAIILGIWAIAGLISFLVNSSMYNIDLHLNTWVLLGSWALAIATLLLQYLALRNGEPPT